MSKSSLQDGAVYDAKSLGASRVIVLGFQHMFAMFGSTILVPALTGLSVSATLLFAGLGTILFHLISKRKVPAFLGSSFAFLAGYFALAPNGERDLLPYSRRTYQSIRRQPRNEILPAYRNGSYHHRYRSLPFRHSSQQLLNQLARSDRRYPYYRHMQYLG